METTFNKTLLTDSGREAGREETKKAGQAMLERQRNMRITNLFAESEAPFRHLGFKTTDTTGMWGEKLKSLTGLLGSGFIVGICGVRWTGKTQLAVELMRAAMNQENSAFYTTSIGFFSRIKASYKKDSEDSERDILECLRSYDLLVIDEVGKRSDTNWENNLLFELIDGRYGDMTDTILIDNRTKEEFISTIGPSLASRIERTGGIVEATWDSFKK